MNNQVLSKVPRIAESVLKEIESHVNAADKHISDEDLLALHSVFGPVLERALDILEKYPTLITYSTCNKTRILIEIQGKNNRCYRVFPKTNFCPCRAFKHQVIEKRTQVTCKHILASRIAQILGKTANHDITQDQYLMLVRSIFDIEE